MDQYVSSNTLALIVSTVIFVVTVALVARQLVGFVITCVMLFFAMASGVAIANNDIVRSYFQPAGEPLPPPTPVHEPGEGSTLDAIRDRIGEVFQQLVEVLSNHSGETREVTTTEKQELRSSIEGLLNQLDEQKQQLQQFLEQHHLTSSANQVVETK
ncbi:MAG: hypothetical protein Q8K75_12050 [Chlamydiales bacterium]|nr:hypothetical protein [Chlamydiales bacterium]